MKKLLLLSVFIIISCTTYKTPKTNEQKPDDVAAVNKFMDDWHRAAANADYDTYFDKIADNGKFIGTDANENWSKEAFIAFAKPYFDKGKAWDFTPLERNIYFSKDGSVVWFDELLDTWMKVCRGSGVLVKENGVWKIKQYILSMTVPNEVTKEVIPLKAGYDKDFTEKLNAAKKQ